MKSPGFVLTLAALVVAGAALFAGDRVVAAREARAERELAQGQLERASRLAGEHPGSFGARGSALVGDAGLKTFAQECATARSATIGYLSESEREGEKGRRERQVLLRLVNAGHQNLVLLLQDLESRGGAKVKELHLRPSREIPDTYEEAEVLLSRQSAAPEASK